MGERNDLQSCNSDIALAIAFGIGYLLDTGYQLPPESGCFSEIDELKTVEVRRWEEDSVLRKISEADQAAFAGICFRIAGEHYPGETPEYLLRLSIGDDEHWAMYNAGSEFVFFSLIDNPKYNYGFFTAPPPGGWTQPLYIAEASSELLAILGLIDNLN